ncbi:TetR/AcrR family transcriptional regulator [Anaerotignum sp. MB30-C6]|uniref:TetR/AcrR family transcriptional regulator n=1 Tax=Anaerotignum sp. MB30-C6 TaxID=3070814 RepID=UPI0027DD1B55|nr:TetR/AcrR family transcriptional regulator [Anaerotignum sp. MB30-C6]WMI79802.1 TetR/AcrR family transcriptional regulator [Anaerotignum sp. MB30-C6]
MATADLSINPRILQSAKEEFLKLGFQDASLKAICEKADVTTGALYKRYKGKDDLFSALVEGCLNDLKAAVEEKKSVNIKALSDEALINTWYMDENYMLWWFDYLFQRHDEVILLLNCSEGSTYSNFQHDWVEVLNESTYWYYKEAYERNLTKQEISPKEMHILITAFWSTIFEPFIHNFSWVEIELHCKLVCRLFDWQKAIGFY